MPQFYRLTRIAKCQYDAGWVDYRRLKLEGARCRIDAEKAIIGANPEKMSKSFRYEIAISIT